MNVMITTNTVHDDDSPVTTTLSTTCRRMASSSSMLRRAASRMRLPIKESDGSSSASSLGSKGYEEDSYSSSSMSLFHEDGDHCSFWDLSSSSSSSSYANELVEQSLLQASFAERTAMEMKQVLEWWTTIKMTRNDDDDNDDDARVIESTRTPLVTTCFDNSNDLDVLQRQSLPNNSLILVDDDVDDALALAAAVDIDKKKDHDNNDHVVTLRRSITNLYEQQQTSWNRDSDVSGKGNADKTEETITNTKSMSIIESSSHRKNMLFQDDDEDDTTTTKTTTASSILPSTFRNVKSSLPFLFHHHHDDHDWQGVAQWQTLQVNRLCHETRHMADVLAELTDSTATTSFDDESEDSEDGGGSDSIVRETECADLHHWRLHDAIDDHDDNGIIVMPSKQGNAKTSMRLACRSRDYDDGDDNHHHHHVVPPWKSRQTKRLMGRLVWEILKLVVVWFLMQEMRGMALDRASCLANNKSSHHRHDDIITISHGCVIAAIMHERRDCLLETLDMVHAGEEADLSSSSSTTDAYGWSGKSSFASDVTIWGGKQHTVFL